MRTLLIVPTNANHRWSTFNRARGLIKFWHAKFNVSKLQTPRVSYTTRNDELRVYDGYGESGVDDNLIELLKGSFDVFELVDNERVKR